MLGELPTRRTKMPILKVRGGMSVDVFVLAAEATGFNVHWLGTRSYLCPGVDCAACYAAVGSRWLGLLPVRWAVPQEKGHHVGLLELTAGPYERFAGMCRMLGFSSLLGVSCAVTRSRDRAALRLEPLTEGPTTSAAVREYPEWLIRDSIATLYSLPTSPEGLSLDDWTKEAMPRAAQLIRIALPRAVASLA